MHNSNLKPIIILTLLILFTSISFVYALPLGETSTNQVGESSSNQTSGTLTNPLKSNLNSVGALLNTGIMIFTYLVVLGAVIAFIIVGLKYIMARGNSAKITEATTWLRNIIIGVAIVIGARVIIQIVINTLKATGTVNTEVIQSAENALNGQRLNP
ncbi:MAG: hypothetical protein AAB629_02100 [Patescibacteria group bacterium]